MVLRTKCIIISSQTILYCLSALILRAFSIDTLYFMGLNDADKGRYLFNLNATSPDTIKSCESCHYSIETDTFSWNPSAKDIGLKFQSRDIADLAEALFFPMTDKSWEAHEKMAIDPGDLHYLKSYLDHIAANGLEKKRRFNGNQALFLLGVVILGLFLADILWIKLVRLRFISWCGVVFGLSLVSIIGYEEAVAIGLQEGYQPPQPIKFSHKVHAGQNGTDCLYCHMPSRYGPSAGIPGVNLCFNCHASVLEGSNSGGFEIEKLYGYKDTGQSIEWVRVNNLPDHVVFNHQSHYVNGGIDCEICHGDVNLDDRYRQKQALAMGWCLDCHDTTYVYFSGRQYYLKTFYGSNIPADSLTFRELGGWDCGTCHY